MSKNFNIFAGPISRFAHGLQIVSGIFRQIQDFAGVSSQLALWGIFFYIWNTGAENEKKKKI